MAEVTFSLPDAPSPLESPEVAMLASSLTSNMRRGRPSPRPSPLTFHRSASDECIRASPYTGRRRSPSRDTVTSPLMSTPTLMTLRLGSPRFTAALMTDCDEMVHVEGQLLSMAVDADPNLVTTTGNKPKVTNTATLPALDFGKDGGDSRFDGSQVGGAETYAPTSDRPVDVILEHLRQWYHYITIRNILKCIKKSITFLCSQIGLAIMVVAYCVLGGVMFQELERSDEKEKFINQQQEVFQMRDEYVKLLYNLTERLPIIHPLNWSMEATHILDEYIANLHMKYREEKWRLIDLQVESDKIDNELQWSFAGALLYSITVITTIGYGHITPKTKMGRVMTMFYALVGIPLMFLCLANIGNFFASIFRLTYKLKLETIVFYIRNFIEACNTMMCRKRRRYNANDDRNSMSRQPSMRIAKQLQTRQQQARAARQDALSRTGSSQPPAYNDDAMSSNEDYGAQSDIELMSDQKSQMSGTTGTAGQYNITVQLNEPSIQRTRSVKPPESNNDGPVSVPIFLCVLVIVSYILSGAFLFMSWENWEFLEGAYFCFITLSTIGFGDYVPGSMYSDTEYGMTGAEQEKLIVLSLWLLVGMSVISMCLGLMQEEVKNKVRRFGQKIGIIDPDD